MKGIKLLFVVAALGFTACPPPNVLIEQTMLKDAKLAQSYVYQRGDDPNLFDYKVRVCDIKGNNSKATGCKDTVVLERIIR